MLKTKNVLMLVVLSTGLLTALGATMISQATPVFAEKEECEDNDDKKCNKKEIEQTNDCQIVVDNSGNSGGTSENNAGLNTDCSNFCKSG